MPDWIKNRFNKFFFYKSKRSRLFVLPRKIPLKYDVFIVFCRILFVIIDCPMSVYRTMKYKSIHPPAGNMIHEKSFCVKFDQKNIGPINLR